MIESTSPLDEAMTRPDHDDRGQSGIDPFPAEFARSEAAHALPASGEPDWSQESSEVDDPDRVAVQVAVVWEVMVSIEGADQMLSEMNQLISSALDGVGGLKVFSHARVAVPTDYVHALDDNLRDAIA